MSFVNPKFLFALFCIIIPIVIHLFNFRRFKKINFSNVNFLKELKNETNKKSKIKHLLVLFSRILAVLFIVLGFSQPYIPEKGAKDISKGTVVSIYIDNSFSMEALSGKGSLIEEAKLKAVEIANAYKSTDLFQILTNDFEGKHQMYITREEFIQLIKDVEVSSKTRKLSEVIARQKDIFSTINSKKKLSYIISDFPVLTTDILNLKADSNIETNLTQLIAKGTNNIFIDSCWFDTPIKQIKEPIELNVLIKNSSKNDVEKVPVKLSINGNQKAVSSVDINAESETKIKMSYTIGEIGDQMGVVEIIDYPLTFDDKFYFSYNVSSSIQILCINDKRENIYLNSLFSKDSTINFENKDLNLLEYSSFNENSLIILNNIKLLTSGLMQELGGYLKNGGSLLISPSIEADINNYKTFLLSLGSVCYTIKDTAKTKVSSINVNHEIYKDVFEKILENIDLPIVKTHFSFNNNTSTKEEYLMKMQNGESFMISEKVGKGKLYLSSVPLDIAFSNFVKHAMFVPTIYNIALYSKAMNKLFYTIGNDEAIEIRNIKTDGDLTYKISNKTNNFEIIPEHKNIDLQTYVYPHDQIKRADNYVLMKGVDTNSVISYNYNRTESEMNFYSIEELKDLIKLKGLKNFNIFDLENKSATKVFEEMSQGVRLWKLFIILGLLFLIVEVVLLRFLKN